MPELNESAGLIGNMLGVDIFGSQAILAFFVVLIILLLALYSGASLLEFCIIFVMPSIIIFSMFGYLPDYLQWLVLIICAFITILGLMKVLLLRTQ